MESINAARGRTSGALENFLKNKRPTKNKLIDLHILYNDEDEKKERERPQDSRLLHHSMELAALDAFFTPDKIEKMKKRGEEQYAHLPLRRGLFA